MLQLRCNLYSPWQ